jgi:DNA (cytosine-5)-methyltransferase 1
VTIRSQPALDFFAGSGLVRLGLEPDFQVVWANDNCSKKAAVYAANTKGSEFHLADVRSVNGGSLPRAALAWASFPCQDLSLAGNRSGIKNGTRSGLFWEWLRVLDEMEAAHKQPAVLCAENVVGFLSADGGSHFKAAYRALRDRGFRAGAIVIDARWFLPQSRPRTFLIAVSEDVWGQTPPSSFLQSGPSLPFHTAAVVRAAAVVDDARWVWWKLPLPEARAPRFEKLCERNAPCDAPLATRRLLTLLSDGNRKKLREAVAEGRFLAGTGYRRTRYDHDHNRMQRLEIRFDGIAGCLRTPEGGSSRQTVLMVQGGKIRSRLMTVRECARLMGAADSFKLPVAYNDGYRAMGDAVAVPVTRFLARHLLAPLARGL